MRNPTIHDALRALGCAGGWKLKDGEISGWTCETPQPSDEAIQTKLVELQADYDSQKYQRDRKLEYPSIEELVVALYDESDKASIIKRRNAVKAKYPKPE
jgi:hypothetical protein